MQRGFIVALPLLALGACTSHLELAPITPLAGGKQTAETIPKGVPYALYYDRFAVTVTYTIADCDDLTLEVEPTVTEVTAEPDPQQTYVLDPNSLAGALKTSSVALEYHPDGSIASINAKAEDRTAETVGALAKSAAGVVKIIAAAGGGEQKPKIACNAKTKAAFAAYTAQKEAVKTSSNSIDQAQLEFDAAKAAVDASAAAVAKPVQARFNNAYLSLQSATRKLAADKAKLAKLAGDISVTAEFTWPDSGSKTGDVLQTPPELIEALAKWGDQSADVNAGTYALTIALESTQPGAMGSDAGLPQLDRKALARGLPYRSPARGKLVIRSAFIGADGNPVPPKVLFEKTYMIRQLGRVFQLPCTSKPFTSVSCSLAFDAKGQLTKAGTENSKAQGEAAAGLLGSLVDSSATASDALNAAAEKRRAAGAKAKQDELAELELDAKLAAARKAAGPQTKTEQQVKEDQILEYETDLKLISARKALAEAQGQVTN